jgi:hypothetical protein
MKKKTHISNLFQAKKTERVKYIRAIILTGSKLRIKISGL